MAVKNFNNTFNQKLWDSYYSFHLEAWNKENKEKLEQETFTEEARLIASKKVFNALSAKTITPYTFREAQKRMSINQYKTIMLTLEEYIDGRSFEELTFEELSEFEKTTTKQNRLNHLSAFLVTCISNRLMRTSNDIILYLIPETYKGIVKIMFE